MHRRARRGAGQGRAPVRRGGGLRAPSCSSPTNWPPATPSTRTSTTTWRCWSPAPGSWTPRSRSAPRWVWRRPLVPICGSTSRVTALHVGTDGVEVIVADETLRARRAIVATGAWFTDLVPELELPLRVQRSALIWFQGEDRAAYRPDRFPVFVRENAEMDGWGIPDVDGAGVKIGAGPVGAEAVALPRQRERLPGQRARHRARGGVLQAGLPGAGSGRRGRPTVHELQEPRRRLRHRHPRRGTAPWFSRGGSPAMASSTRRPWATSPSTWPSKASPTFPGRVLPGPRLRGRELTWSTVRWAGPASGSVRSRSGR